MHTQEKRAFKNQLYEQFARIGKALSSSHRLELLERDVTKLTEELDQRRQSFAAGRRSLQGQPVAEARAAVSLGLAREAVDDILLPSPANLLGREGIHLAQLLAELLEAPT